MEKPDYLISTPENVDLHLELAGLGNRALAVIIDTLATYALCIVVFLLAWLGTVLVAMGHLPPNAVAIVSSVIVLLAMLASFAIAFGYFIFFEGIWHGQTPGKKVTHIRVIDQTGQPINWGAAVLRNIIRVFDLGFLLIGLLFMAADKNERRLGDFAAGTLVVRERASDFRPVRTAVTDSTDDGANLDVGRINPQEYELLVTFLKRRTAMSRRQRPTVARQLEQHFREKLSEPADGIDKPEAFLEKVYNAYQSRAE